MDNRNHRKPIIRHKNPSFSSSLLDEIYRSIDDQTPTAAAKEDHHKTGKKMGQNVDVMLLNKVVGRKKSASAEYKFPQSFRLNSSSSSSDSSIWTSSESETFGQSKLAARKSFSSQQQHHQQQQQDDKNYVSQRKLKNESGGFVKAKSKTLKMYDDMKNSKTKQPISPGSRLASFLNSLFTSTGNAKKAKNQERKYKYVNASTSCSSASSFTRSCFSKTPSSRGKLSDGVKRSVRFYPVISVIMDEDRRYTDNERRNYNNIPVRNSTCGEEIRENNRRAREVLKNYEKKLEECKMMDNEDCESCASSDLFELDNLDSVTSSRQRYCEELPVYETTSLDANRAIAHGLLL